MRRDDVLELIKPKERDFREDLALVRHALPERSTDTVRVGDSRATVHGDEGA